MKLEIFNKRYGKRPKNNFPTIRFLKCKNSALLCSNKIFNEKAKDYGFATVLFDKEDKIFALKFSKEHTNNSLLINKTKSKCFSIAIGSFLNWYDVGKLVYGNLYKVEYKDNLWIAHLRKPINCNLK